MWGSTGRSGYGDSTIGGDYDSWDGISPNGRQYKNEITGETRDLSGADYWHLRKQNRPTEEIPAHLHMLNKDRANIEAYADKPTPVKKVSKVDLRDKILPQRKRVLTLTQQLIELENAYRAGEMDIKQYSLYRDILCVKRDRALELYEIAVNKGKARSNPPSNSEETSTQTDDSREAVSAATPHPSIVTNTWIDGISDGNSFKFILQKALQASRKIVQWTQAARNYINELKAV